MSADKKSRRLCCDWRIKLNDFSPKTIFQVYQQRDEHFVKPCLEVIKLFSCSTQLSKKFQLLINTKIPTNQEVSCFTGRSLRCCIYNANKC